MCLYFLSIRHAENLGTYLNVCALVNSCNTGTGRLVGELPEPHTALQPKEYRSAVEEYADVWGWFAMENMMEACER